MATILVADDEENFRDLLDMILGSLGHTCLGASSGAEALEKLQSEQVDLFLCDLVMGEMSGTEAMQQARDLRPELKIVAVSGAANFARQSENGLPLGADAMVGKPFKIEQLAGTIDELLKGGASTAGQEATPPLGN